ncbi:hypothetical protein ILUMI_10988 [Ignelater luminosus]|uniref:Mediator of RNA polymerase II transcription subunit 13 n=1 Tax=Ignelater luminosus TaxID=2038154 RepID=A0A8K0D293_IGNLU|nr:hypothetical protein ILUMI_10988 [Ignelater luminosus]
MSAAYSKRFEAVFLCCHEKGPKMSLGAAATYLKKSKSLVKKWYSELVIENCRGDEQEIGKATQNRDHKWQRSVKGLTRIYEKRMEKKVKIDNWISLALRNHEPVDKTSAVSRKKAIVINHHVTIKEYKFSSTDSTAKEPKLDVDIMTIQDFKDQDVRQRKAFSALMCQKYGNAENNVIPSTSDPQKDNNEGLIEPAAASELDLESSEISAVSKEKNTHSPVDHALKGKNENAVFDLDDERGRKSPHNKTPDVLIQKIKGHVESFPTMESHYWRKSSNRIGVIEKQNQERQWKQDVMIENREESNNNLEEFQPESNDDQDSDYQKVSEDENNQEISRSPSDLSNESLHVDKENEPNNKKRMKVRRGNAMKLENIHDVLGKFILGSKKNSSVQFGYQHNAQRTENLNNQEFRTDTTLQYCIKIDEVNVPVCKKLLETFGLGEWQVNNWVKKSKHIISNVEKDNKETKDIFSTRVPNVVMKNFLENLNKLSSHYCRKDTNKLYLEQSFTGIWHTLLDTELSGIKWRKLVWSDGGGGGEPLDDPVLRSYARCLAADILCVWRRVSAPRNDNLFDIVPPAPEQPPPLSLAAAKELWIFWYGEEPDLAVLVAPELIARGKFIRTNIFSEVVSPQVAEGFTN